MITHTPARLFAILAREAPVGVVFRRGPTGQVLLIRWDTARDTFECGQWFKGRIYERRCDLSPSGSKLIYFAGNHKPPYRTWTAVSTPPYLTALALWPAGDTWGGGGLFKTETTICLNGSEALAEGFTLPTHVRIEPLERAGAAGEPAIASIAHRRLLRDGWRLVQHQGRTIWNEQNDGLTYRRPCPGQPERGIELEMTTMVNVGPGATEELVEYRLVSPQRNTVESLGFLDWADWDRRGDLVYATQGTLFRLKPRRSQQPMYDLKSAQELADFSGLTFEQRVAPAAALKW